MILYLSAAVHDLDHPGYNNAFIINSNHEIALTYNDKSVLENFHISSFFKLLKNKPEINPFKHLKDDKAKFIRQNMIKLVLGTDMSKHFTEIGKIKGRLS